MNIDTNIPTDQIAPAATQAPGPEPKRTGTTAGEMTLEEAERNESAADRRFTGLIVNRAPKEEIDAAYRELSEARAAKLKIQETLKTTNALPNDTKPASVPKEIGKGTLEEHEVNDRLNGLRLANKYHKLAKYIPAKRVWVGWSDSGVWRFDRLEGAMNMGKEIAAGLYKEISEASIDTDRKAALMKDVIKHQNASHISASVRLAQSDTRIAKLITDFDSHPYLINCTNGVLDLKTGKLTPHGPATRELYLTKQCPVAYDPNARSEEWESFLNTALQGDKDLIRYVQKAAGYSLTGDCQDEVFFFIHGQTRTGKSTFISAVNSVMGPYHLSTNFESFLQSRSRDGKGPSEDVARMAGARMISAIETSEGRKMDMGLMKKLTGRDKLTARELYEKSFEFDMTAKLWLVANDPPIVSENDEAIWARLIELPFTYRVPPEQLDPGLKTRLSDTSLNGAAILNWMVQGCQMWMKDGALTGKKPEKVLVATQAYRQRMNPLSSFVEDRLERDADAPPLNAQRLYDAYQRYHEESTNKKWEKIPKITFTKKMQDLGFECRRDWYNPESKRQEDVWTGLRLKAEVIRIQTSQQQMPVSVPPADLPDPGPASDADVPPEKLKAQGAGQTDAPGAGA